MDEFNDNEIARLLRLKRYEQPPPGYFENFLHEFHRRQRNELLRQPLWRICWERAQDFMFRLDVRSLASYPVAAAAVCGMRGSHFIEDLSGTTDPQCRSPESASIIRTGECWRRMDAFISGSRGLSGRNRFVASISAPKLTPAIAGPRPVTCSIACP